MMGSTDRTAHVDLDQIVEASWLRLRAGSKRYLEGSDTAGYWRLPTNHRP